MFAKLIEFSLTQRMFTLAVTALLIAGGAFAFSRLPIDAFPDISTTQVKIIMKAPGMTPEEVELRVIAPLEMELLGIPHQKILRSMAKYAIADITIDFEDSADIYWARQQVAERMANAAASLPSGVEGGLAPISTPLSDVFMFTIEGGDLSLEERRTLLDWTIRPALRTLPGVADVNALGGLVRTFNVTPDLAALAAAGVSLGELKSAIESSNRNDGAGRISEGEEALAVRAIGGIETLQDLKSVVVSQSEGHVLRVGDLAAVSVGSLTRYGAVTKDGQGEAVEGIVLSLRGADANAIVRNVERRLEELKTSLPEGVVLKTFYDRSALIEKAIHGVTKALIEAIILVLILLLAFLGNVRAAIVVAVTLPLAALFTFIMMRVSGMSANLMSLGGLAIAIGLIVDAAVVVVENAADELSHSQSHVPKLHKIFRAAKEVSTPVASGILIICLVFLPLLALQGLEGKLFRPVALTIVFALAGSLFLSMTVIPVLASYFLPEKHGADPLLMRIITPAYSKLLDFALAKPVVIYAIAGVGLVFAVIAYLGVGKTFMPTMDEGSVIMQAAKLPSINLDRSLEGDLLIERALMEDVPEIEGIVARVGSDELGLDPMGLNESDIFMVLKPKKEWRKKDKEWVIDQMRTAMHELPGIEPSFTQPIEMRTSEMLTGARGDLAVKIFGPDLQTLARLAGEVQTAIAEVDGASEVFTLSNDTVDYMSLELDRVAIGAASLNLSDTQDDLRALLEGVDGGIVIEPGRRTQIILKGDEVLRRSPDAFARAQLVAPEGELIRIGDFASISLEPAGVKIDRENASRFALIQAYVSGRDLVGFVEDAQRAVAEKVALPQGYRLAWGGEFENQRRAAARLGLVIPIALALIFLVLFATLRSLRQAALIMANVPFALVGGILALTLSGEYLSVPASVGFIALLGIAVLNLLVLVSYYNQLLSAGVPFHDVIKRGAVRRLRPVLMTASIAAFGLVPLLFAEGPGSEIQRPLAIVVIGGLISSTILTLLLLPILFRRFGLAAAETEEKKGGLAWAPLSAN
ncbi:MAG TPA: CusA/CzcA family heavy metal efflux RND transporter [Parvularculaceae bacterium]|nr:CusA/CzcA family heavy metal efflux RND transporter [Parvularculaceae bacterium]